MRGVSSRFRVLAVPSFPLPWKASGSPLPTPRDLLTPPSPRLGCLCPVSRLGTDRSGKNQYRGAASSKQRERAPALPQENRPKA